MGTNFFGHLIAGFFRIGWWKTEGICKIKAGLKPEKKNPGTRKFSSLDECLNK